MSVFLDNIKESCRRFPNILAFKNSTGEQITYSELARYSDALACFLFNNYASCISTSLQTVVLRGHKQPNMIVAMLACMKAGLCYVPLDSSLPEDRVRNILAQLHNPFLIEVEEGSCSAFGEYHPLNAQELNTICQNNANEQPDPNWAISEEDAHYILFTSGSTGTPKGVVQPARSVDHTFRYFEHFIPKSAGINLTFFNRAHFSFDLSLFDLVIALPFGHTMFALDANTEESLAKTFEALQTANPHLWVSTPSFLNLCLADSSFNQELLPNLQSVVVCGETLFASTASKLLNRFPSVKLYNSYGPTEAQGAITDVEITHSLLEAHDVLPVGICSPFNELQIVSPENKLQLPTGQKGEICILGSTIASGYFGREDLTQKSFTTKKDSSGMLQPAYFTGDAGMLDANGMLWFSGRFDNQVKVNGFRIELQEIEFALNNIEDIVESCVTVESKSELASYLVAHVVIKPTEEKQRSITKRLKEELKRTLPAYMIPRLFSYYDALPKSVNGKIDRKALASDIPYSSSALPH